jgi:hypothetical protein
MSTPGQAVTHTVSTVWGGVWGGAPPVRPPAPGLVAAVVAAVAVLAGSVFRPAATMAVLVTVAVLVLADAPPLLTATSGLCAAAYLVLRHTATVTAPTVLGAVGLTAAGLAAVSLPIELPWVPLLAPLAVLLIYVVVTRPFWAK